MSKITALPNLNQNNSDIRKLVSLTIDLKQRCQIAKRLSDDRLYGDIMSIEDKILETSKKYELEEPAWGMIDGNYVKRSDSVAKRLVFASRLVRGYAITDAGMKEAQAVVVLQEMIDIMRSCYADVASDFKYLNIDQNS